MYRIIKTLNHNAILAADMEDNQEYILLGKGIGFGKKVSERLEAPEDVSIYSLRNVSEQGKAKEFVRDIPAECFEISNRILEQAEAEFGKIDRDILFPMANHIAYAVKRIQAGEQISNPLTSDIRILFYKEYKIAELSRALLKEMMQVEIMEDEIGYIALHVHSSIEDEKVATSMQMAMVVRECVSLIEKQTRAEIDILSLDYNRLMNHVKFMFARVVSGEVLKVNMNAYIMQNYPKAYEIASTVCEHMGRALNKTLEDVEIGYLAMHVERVLAEEN
ncbi:MAG: PRD domain-containing protein [Bacteroides sp.]|nr:PRD domain-containing protein [Bacteroides sp.]MCM1550141.1 PRD domain-containing protein [Clostridium sp.]